MRTGKKKTWLRTASVIMCAVVLLVTIGLNKIDVKAVDILATVKGVVLQGTTADMVKLYADGENMLIKIDSSTDMSGCKTLISGTNVSISVYRGTDAYLHAARITTDLQTEGVRLDESTKKTVYGEILESSTATILRLRTSSGDMAIKYNASTDVSGCRLIVPGRNVYVTICKGDDNSQHALSISDAGTTGNASSGSSSTPTNSNSNQVDYTVYANSTGTITTVTGIVQDKTNDQYIYLSTSGGDMCIKVDGALDTTNGRAIITGRQVTAYVYRATDAYMHATRITCAKDATTPVSLDYSASYTVTGTVNKLSTDNILIFDAGGEQMQIKLDDTTSYNNIKFFYEGKSLTVACVRGSDAYLHATVISGN